MRLALFHVYATPSGHLPSTTLSTPNRPTNSGYIEYRDPLEYVKEMNMHYDLEGWKWKKVKAITGDVLIFPGYLRHRTESSFTNEERWVLTTNIMNLNRPPLKK
jgi:hypothetical protein